MPTARADIEDRLLTEATARVTWGDLPEDVAQMLVSQGVDARQAGKLVQRLVAERSIEVRQRSFVKLVTGMGMVLAAALGFYLAGRWDSSPWGRMEMIFSGGSLALGITGLVGVCRGLTGLLLPAATELTDVDEDDGPEDDLPPLPRP